MSRREISYALFAPGITPIKSQIPPQIGMVDMSQSYVKVKLRLKHADGTALEAPSHMYPVNNFGHSIFKDVKVTLNGTLISGQSSLYPYKAYFDQLINHDTEDGKTLLNQEGWWNGLSPHEAGLTANQLDITHDDFKALSEQEQVALLGMRKEYSKLREKERTFIIRPFSELFHMSKALIPGVAMNIQFTLNDAAFSMMRYRGAQDASIQAQNIKVELVLCHISPRADLEKTLDIKLLRKITSYPTVRSEIRSYSVNNTTRNVTIDNPFSARIPNLLIVGMVRSHAFNGDYDHYPFFFQLFNLSNIKQFIRGEEYPYKTLQLTQDDQSDSEGYHRFLEATGCFRKGKANMVLPEEWGHGKGCSLIAFDNTANGKLHNSVLKPRLSGSHCLEFLFGNDQGTNINILLYGEFENVLDIDGNRAIIYDVTSGAAITN